MKNKRSKESGLEQRIDRAAVQYLLKYTSSKDHFRKILLRHLKKWSGNDRDAYLQGVETVDRVVARYQDKGLVNDLFYAVAKAKTYHKKGLPSFMIKFKLREKGIQQPDIDKAMEKLRDDHDDLDYWAAYHFARKRKIGPFRKDQERQQYLNFDLATLVRAGFSFDVAQRIVQTVSDNPALGSS